MAPKAARGSALIFGLSPEERGFGIPGTAFDYFRASLPVSFGLTRSEEDDGAVNPNSFREPGMPSVIRGDGAAFSHVLTARHLLPVWHHFFGTVTKTEIQPGVWRYVFEGSQNEPSMNVVVSTPPVETFHVTGYKIATIEIPLGVTSALTATMTGVVSHGSSYDLAIPAGGNTGTYEGPVLQGPVRYKKLGDIHVQVVTTSPLTYLAEMTTGVPTFPGSPVTAALDVAGKGVWQNLQGALRLPGTVDVAAGTALVAGTDTEFTKYAAKGMLVDIAGVEITILSVDSDTQLTLSGNHGPGAAGVPIHLLQRDFGWVDENNDPIRINFPGGSAEHALAAANDQWRYNYNVAVPSPTYISARRFNMSHVVYRFREIGEVAWLEPVGIEATLRLEWPLEPEAGSGSNYITALDRTGLLFGSLTFNQVYRDKTFVEFAEAHTRFETEIRIEGRQLGDGSVREGVVFYMPYSGAQDAARTIADQGRIPLNTSILGTTNLAGASPVRVTVTCQEDWIPPTYV